jgi:hypothetical protein
MAGAAMSVMAEIAAMAMVYVDFILVPSASSLPIETPDFKRFFTNLGNGWALVPSFEDPLQRTYI